MTTSTKIKDQRILQLKNKKITFYQINLKYH